MLVMRRQMESETPSDHEEDHPSARAAIEALRLQLNAALLGKSEVVELVLAGLLVSAPRTAGARSLAERIADFQANPQGWQRVSASAEQATTRAALTA
jgi:hypothetical protein